MSSTTSPGRRRLRAVASVCARGLSSLSFGKVLVGAAMLWMAVTFISMNAGSSPQAGSASVRGQSTATVELAGFVGPDPDGTGNGSGPPSPLPRWAGMGHPQPGSRGAVPTIGPRRTTARAGTGSAPDFVTGLLDRLARLWQGRSARAVGGGRSGGSGSVADSALTRDEQVPSDVRSQRRRLPADHVTCGLPCERPPRPAPPPAMGQLDRLMGGIVDLVSGIVSTVAGEPAGERARQGLSGVAEQVSDALASAGKLSSSGGAGGTASTAPRSGKSGRASRRPDKRSGTGPALAEGGDSTRPGCAGRSGCAGGEHALAGRRPATQAARGPPAAPRDRQRTTTRTTNGNNDLTKKITDLTDKFVSDLAQLLGVDGGAGQGSGSGNGSGGRAQASDQRSGSGADRPASFDEDQDLGPVSRMSRPRPGGPSSDGSGIDQRRHQNVEQVLDGVTDLVSGLVTLVAGKQAGARAREVLGGLADDVSDALAANNRLEHRGMSGAPAPGTAGGMGHGSGPPATAPDDGPTSPSCDDPTRCGNDDALITRRPSTAPARGPPARRAATRTASPIALTVTPTTRSPHASIQPDPAHNRYLITALDPRAPTSYDFHLTLPQGGHAAKNRDGGVDIIDGSGRRTQTIAPPWAKDAHGTPVPTSFSVHGDTLTQRIAPNARNAYPILADPAAAIPDGAGGLRMGKTKPPPPAPAPAIPDGAGGLRMGKTKPPAPAPAAVTKSRARNLHRSKTSKALPPKHHAGAVSRVLYRRKGTPKKPPATTPPTQPPAQASPKIKPPAPAPAIPDGAGGLRIGKTKPPAPAAVTKPSRASDPGQTGSEKSLTVDRRLLYRRKGAAKTPPAGSQQHHATQPPPASSSSPPVRPAHIYDGTAAQAIRPGRFGIKPPPDQSKAGALSGLNQDAGGADAHMDKKTAPISDGTDQGSLRVGKTKTTWLPTLAVKAPGKAPKTQTCILGQECTPLSGGGFHASYNPNAAPADQFQAGGTDEAHGEIGAQVVEDGHGHRQVSIQGRGHAVNGHTHARLDVTQVPKPDTTTLRSVDKRVSFDGDIHGEATYTGNEHGHKGVDQFDISDGHITGGDGGADNAGFSTTNHGKAHTAEGDDLNVTQGAADVVVRNAQGLGGHMTIHGTDKGVGTGTITSAEGAQLNCYGCDNATHEMPKKAGKGGRSTCKVSSAGGSCVGLGAAGPYPADATGRPGRDSVAITTGADKPGSAHFVQHLRNADGSGGGVTAATKGVGTAEGHDGFGNWVKTSGDGGRVGLLYAEEPGPHGYHEGQSCVPGAGGSCDGSDPVERRLQWVEPDHKVVSALGGSDVCWPSGSPQELNEQSDAELKYLDAQSHLRWRREVGTPAIANVIKQARAHGGSPAEQRDALAAGLAAMDPKLLDRIKGARDALDTVLKVSATQPHSIDDIESQLAGDPALVGAINGRAFDPDPSKKQSQIDEARGKINDMEDAAAAAAQHLESPQLQQLRDQAQHKQDAAQQAIDAYEHGHGSRAAAQRTIKAANDALADLNAREQPFRTALQHAEDQLRDDDISAADVALDPDYAEGLLQANQNVRDITDLLNQLSPPKTQADADTSKAVADFAGTIATGYDAAVASPRSPTSRLGDLNLPSTGSSDLALAMRAAASRDYLNHLNDSFNSPLQTQDTLPNGQPDPDAQPRKMTPDELANLGATWIPHDRAAVDALQHGTLTPAQQARMPSVPKTADDGRAFIAGLAGLGSLKEAVEGDPAKVAALNSFFTRANRDSGSYSALTDGMSPAEKGKLDQFVEQVDPSKPKIGSIFGIPIYDDITPPFKYISDKLGMFATGVNRDFNETFGSSTDNLGRNIGRQAVNFVTAIPTFLPKAAADAVVEADYSIRYSNSHPPPRLVGESDHDYWARVNPLTTTIEDIGGRGLDMVGSAATGKWQHLGHELFVKPPVGVLLGVAGAGFGALRGKAEGSASTGKPTSRTTETPGELPRTSPGAAMPLLPAAIGEGAVAPRDPRHSLEPARGPPPRANAVHEPRQHGYRGGMCASDVCGPRAVAHLRGETPPESARPEEQKAGPTRTAVEHEVGPFEIVPVHEFPQYVENVPVGGRIVAWTWRKDAEGHPDGRSHMTVGRKTAPDEVDWPDGPPDLTRDDTVLAVASDGHRAGHDTPDETTTHPDLRHPPLVGAREEEPQEPEAELPANAADRPGQAKGRRWAATSQQRFYIQALQTGFIAAIRAIFNQNVSDDVGKGLVFWPHERPKEVNPEATEGLGEKPAAWPRALDRAWPLALPFVKAYRYLKAMPWEPGGIIGWTFPLLDVSHKIPLHHDFEIELAAEMDAYLGAIADSTRTGLRRNEDDQSKWPLAVLPLERATTSLIYKGLVKAYFFLQHFQVLGWHTTPLAGIRPPKIVGWHPIRRLVNRFHSYMKGLSTSGVDNYTFFMRGYGIGIPAGPLLENRHLLKTLTIRMRGTKRAFDVFAGTGKKAMSHIVLPALRGVGKLLPSTIRGWLESIPERRTAHGDRRRLAHAERMLERTRDEIGRQEPIARKHWENLTHLQQELRRLRWNAEAPDDGLNYLSAEGPPRDQTGAIARLEKQIAHEKRKYITYARAIKRNRQQIDGIRFFLADPVKAMQVWELDQELGKNVRQIGRGQMQQAAIAKEIDHIDKARRQSWLDGFSATSHQFLQRRIVRLLNARFVIDDEIDAWYKRSQQLREQLEDLVGPSTKHTA